MAEYEISDVIDLTVPVHNNFRLSNTVIFIDSDDSFNLNCGCDDIECETPTKNKEKRSRVKKSNETIQDTFTEEYNSRLGACPICFEKLGKNPLVSTICGHVYCLKCLQQALLFEKKCPTCRKSLKNKSSYHRLYLHI